MNAWRVSMIGLLALSASAEIHWHDLSEDTSRHVVIAQGTDTIYQGHPTTVLLPDGLTIYCVWTYEHGGHCGPMKRSHDGGRTWSELLPVPETWRSVVDCPSIYRTTDPVGRARLLVFAGGGPDGCMYRAYSDDDGHTWSEMETTLLPTSPSTADVQLRGGMPFTTLVPIRNGQALLAMTNVRRPRPVSETTATVRAGGSLLEPWRVKVQLDPELRTNILVQSVSTDGGLTWSPWKVALDKSGVNASEPWVVRSPDGKQLLCLIRENGTRVSLRMVSNDEGESWSEPVALATTLHGDRHVAKYLPDGRLIVCFRDRGIGSPTANHFVGWIGSYEDIVDGRAGDHRVKLLHSHSGADCGYPGVEVLPDGTIVATTYVKYRPGPERSSVVSVRFNASELQTRGR